MFRPAVALLFGLHVAGGPAPSAAAEPAAGDAVVLLHGLGRSDRSMRPLADRLARAGFAVHNLRYPSRTRDPEALVQLVAEEVDACCSAAARLHFVTHSLGGILVRAYLARERPANLGRVVMLAPPNHGSELADALAGSKIAGRILGPTGSQLGTGADSLPNRLPSPDYEVGIIAGDAPLNPIGASLIPGDDDGTVSVVSAKLEGMADFLQVPHSHSFIMRSDAVGDQVVRFLQTGRFHHVGGAPFP